MISKSNVKFTDSKVKQWLLDSLHRPSKKLGNYLKIKIRKILNDRQKWRRNCSTNILKRKISRSHTTKGISPSVMWKRDNAFVVIFFKTMYNKTIIRFGFCDFVSISVYQPQPSASADNTYLELDYSGYHKNLIQ